jgi:hypothetical protein
MRARDMPKRGKRNDDPAWSGRQMHEVTSGFRRLQAGCLQKGPVNAGAFDGPTWTCSRRSKARSSGTAPLSARTDRFCEHGLRSRLRTRQTVASPVRRPTHRVPRWEARRHGRRGSPARSTRPTPEITGHAASPLSLVRVGRGAHRAIRCSSSWTSAAAGGNLAFSALSLRRAVPPSRRPPRGRSRRRRQPAP